MKGLKLFLAACFIVPMFDGAMAADTPRNTARATQSGRGNTTVSTARKTAQQTTKQRTPTNNNVISRTATSKSVVTRTTQKTTPEKSRTATVAPRKTTTTVARSTKKPNALTRAANALFSRVPTKNSGKSRAATTVTRESIMQRNFSKCKTVFFECMDEFCAQKNAQLKRCACSARAGEFTSTQKSLDAVEDKLSDFSQHLLKVNMDPADAAVINQESEGERAYNQTKDKTASKKILDEIAKKLNTDFNSAENGTGLGALSWSLNADSAFDSVDSLAGVSTTAKSGTALRNAALPVCREMAAEVCADDDISLVENSYTMAIEQDCNTVKKAYETQTQAARTKVLEGSALLDMTRLNTYQENNADDILTCKSKMLDMLSNTSVCGENLTKCLDISGRYINPTTGEAFLSPDLVKLATLIVRPSSTDSWVGVPANSSFVTYLNSKKKYLESATQNCQAIADDVWDVFIEDALAQIKLAQNAKLEEVRQSCTTLLTECITNANENLTNFDSRALSTFGVGTDKTANALCTKVKASCSGIMAYTPDENSSDIADTWTQGTTEIAAMETYDRIINTCRQLGRDCIVNSCKSITGNFGLCESIHGSVNRHAILTRSACWDEVYNCVAQASEESITQIHSLLPYNDVPRNLYAKMYRFDGYGTPQNNAPHTADNVYDICKENSSNLGSPCGIANTDAQTVECYKCRLAEQIWGNCQQIPENQAYNPILIPSDPNKTTLLSWFANNTHTADQPDSCSVSMCPAGYTVYASSDGVQCLDADNVVPCTNNSIPCFQALQITTPMNHKNCCPTNYKDSWGNCCLSNQVSTTISNYANLSFNPNMDNINICVPSNTARVTLLHSYSPSNGTNKYILCTGNIYSTSEDIQDQVRCDGTYIILECVGNKCYYDKVTPASDTVEHHYQLNYFIAIDRGQPSYDMNNYCAAATTPSNPYRCSWNGTEWQNCADTQNSDGEWLVDF
ncbi:MAG: hypothetical protein J5608_02660 [Alphaproteobacteria bacterium]|nr:hypothetical protein [Alphaproteobacteria bacterium]